MYDVIIVGAGCMGSASAYYAAKSGLKTLLLEQFEFGHNQGSSHGYSRIIRKSYAEAYFVNMMHQAYTLWHELEAESGETLINKTGGLDFGRIGDEYLERTIQACTSSGINFELLTATEIRSRFPMISVPDNYKGIYQSDAGVLNPYQSLPIIRNLAERNGALLQDKETMLSFEDNGDHVVVKTNEGEYKTKKLILTVGPWVKDLLKEHDLTLDADIWKMSLGYYKVSTPDRFVPDNFPIFIAMDGPIFYGFPVIEKPGMIKVAPHFTTEIIDINNRTFDLNEDLISKVSDFVSRSFPEVDPKPQEQDTCLYTYTPDENFVLDFLPKSENIVVGAGFSGHGFKFTPLIGKTLVALCQGSEIGFNLKYFNIDNHIL